MSRFWVAPDDIQGKSVVLRDQEAHHLTHVLRFRPGDKVVVFDGAGSEYRCRVEELGKKECRLEILEKLPPRKSVRHTVTLAHSVTRGERFDWVVEKGTELGMAEIIPFICERVAYSLDPKSIAKKVERWQKLAQAAAKQCGRTTVPKVNTVIEFDNLIQRFRQFDLVLLAYELEEHCSLKNILRKELEGKSNQPHRILAIVGPEGGFSQKEVEQMIQARARSVSIGENILRTETAAIAMLSMIFYELMP